MTKFLILFPLICFLPLALLGQSLVVNGGFEDVNVCSEYHAPCAPEGWFRIPPTDLNVNTKKVSRVYEGKHAEIVVIENEDRPKSYRVFLYTMLLCPLEPEQTYTLTFYLNPIFQSAYEIGILFSEQELITGIINPLRFEPSVLIKSEPTNKKRKGDQWDFIEVQYTAKGGELFLTLGNFSQTAFPFTKKNKANNEQGDLIYLIDQVSLVRTDGVLPPCDTTQAIDLLYATDH